MRVHDISTQMVASEHMSKLAIRLMTSPLQSIMPAHMHMADSHPKRNLFFVFPHDVEGNDHFA